MADEGVVLRGPWDCKCVSPGGRWLVVLGGVYEVLGISGASEQVAGDGA